MQKCDLCNKSAVVHEVTVRSGVKKEIHLCETHAREAGIVMPGAQPINQLLTQFVISQSSKSSTAAKPQVKACPGCGLTFVQFRQVGRLGCAQCYGAFEAELTHLIERAQSGGCHHCGKAPRRSGNSLDREFLVQRLARELDQAVAAEQYERAAQLRDRLTNLDAEKPQVEVPPRSANEPAGESSER
jgi:protein arginine kinase activator